MKIRKPTSLRTRLIARLHTGILYPEVEVTLFDGELNRTALIVFNPIIPFDYLVIYIITSEWTEILGIGVPPPTLYTVPPGRLTIRVRNIHTVPLEYHIGDLIDVWVE